MMGMLWGVFFVALTGSHFGYGLPIGSTPQTYPYDGRAVVDAWGSQGGLYAAVPALALLITAVGLLLGCTWCYRHKDCKLFAANATHLHDVRRSNPPDSGFSEPANNNISEDNNNGPISLREMQNIANNNATAYIVSENEERNRVSRESVVEFEPLPAAIRVADPLEPHADWFGGEDFPRNRLQYLREIGRGWFGRVVEGEIEDEGSTSTVAVKILNQNASLEDKARFLEEARLYRDIRHENVLGFISKCLGEDPWIMIYELCPMDLQQYLIANSHKMATLSESGVPLRLMCDVTAALAHLHSRGHLYGNVWTGAVLVRGAGEGARAVLGSYASPEPEFDVSAPEARRSPPLHTASSEVFSLGALVWQVCAWGRAPARAPPPPDLPCPYRNHLYQVMQLCWNPNPEARPTAAQVHALLNHLYTAHSRAGDPAPGDYGTSDFEDRWQRLKPNSIPIIDEHVAIVHAPSTSMASNFTGSDQDFDNPPTIQDSLSADMDTAVSRSSSIMSDKDPLSVQIKSESLTNLHGSLDDVRNIYLTHNELAVLECHQGNIALDDSRDKEHDHDRSDSSMDPWLKDIIAGSQDDVSYYKDVSDVMKNLDNILNSEKTSSSESSHQASPSRDNLSLDCKKDYPMQSNMVKSPGITNFQNLLDAGLDSPDNETCEDDEVDRDTIGTLSHSFERHSDTLSEQTLENLTPETPIKDFNVACKIALDKENIVEIEEDVEKKSDRVIEIEEITPLPEETELPKENKIVNSDSQIPVLKELCVTATPSISEKECGVTNATQDCIRLCDSNLEDERTDDKEIETKSIDDVVKPDTLIEAIITEFDAKEESRKVEVDNLDDILPNLVDKDSTVKRDIDPVAIVTLELTTKIEDSTAIFKPELQVVANDVLVTTVNEDNASEVIEPDLLDTDNSSKECEQKVSDEITVDVSETAYSSVPQAPELVQNIINSEQTAPTLPHEEKNQLNEIITENITSSVSSPEIVQNVNNEMAFEDELKVQNRIIEVGDATTPPRSEHIETITAEKSNDSTAYMDLINTTNSEIVTEQPIDDNMKEVIKSCLDSSNTESPCTLIKNESTVYMDLPSMIKETDNFLHFERVVSSHNVEFKDICSSTPKGSDLSNDNNVTLEEAVKNNETEILYETKVPDYGPGVVLTKLEQRYVPDSLSPFESPTKSHHTDTYDENSSVVLGPFENCTLELFKCVKSGEIVDLPKEELLAFSSNFSEINLETPSPLRDGRFLNEVPDIYHDDIHFDDLETIGEIKIDHFEPQSESNSHETDCFSVTEKRVSPLTPPNSPGTFLISAASQPSYIVDIDLDPVPGPSRLEANPVPIMPKEVDLNQIELQITTKLAMAENENNLNIEYSGPLSIEGLPDETILLPDPEPEESFLAGNGGSSPRNIVELDEECVKALRNELELKLPLAQVATIEPAPGGEWGGSLPPPPELVLSYPTALSPIPEETRQQLCAIETDLPWSISSESYPEPCHSSAADTAPPTADRTYTLRRDDAHEITMSADSLNASPLKKPPIEPIDSPLDDKTYTKNDDERDSKCERISQVSPFILSPTTDHSDLGDHATAASTLSKTTVPTDAKASKPSEPQCLSKATSIDSWCSNDTLYNVEENFDDLAMDADIPLHFDKEDEHSESSHTLTHNDDDRELSHCSTYIVHDSKSEACETFSPDSITANENYTYTKAKADAANTPSVHTKSELDSTKNTQTKDLAYGTLMSGLPSYSNCTTEVASAFDDAWKLPQPELVRRSPMADDIDITPPKFPEQKECIHSPQLSAQPCINKMDSVDITCLHDNLADSHDKSEDSDNQNILIEIVDSPNSQYKNMAPSVTSTPLTEIPAGNESVEPILIELPDTSSRTPDFMFNNLPNFQTFLQSAEVRPQDISPNNDGTSHDTEILLEGDSKTLSRNSNRDSIAANDRTPNYSDFENSAVCKPQDVHSRDKSSQSVESGVSSEEFRHFENCVRSCPQDLSSVIDASSLLLHSERRFSELALCKVTSQPGSCLDSYEPIQPLDISPPNHTNLIESHEVDKIGTPNNLFAQLDVEEETEQPHSIIITENDVLIKESPNRTYDSHTEAALVELNHTYDSHEGRRLQDEKALVESPIVDTTHAKVNGIINNANVIKFEIVSPKFDELPPIDNTSANEKSVNNDIEPEVEVNNSSNKIDKKLVEDIEEIKCNGSSEKYATVQFLKETFEELVESNVDEEERKDLPNNTSETNQLKNQENIESISSTAKDVNDISKEKVFNIAEDHHINGDTDGVESQTNGIHDSEDEKLASVTENFLQNEKNFCQLDSYLPLLSDIRFTGPASEIMSTSFTRDSPTSPPASERDGARDTAADILKEWDSDSDSHSTNSSSGEFIWKDGDGHETALVPTTHFDHQRGAGGGGGAGSGRASSGSSGSEGDEVEFVPSSWDCRAAPGKSSLRSLEQASPDNKKRVVFKRQKYHCVYEYPREAADDARSPAAYAPDLSTYSEWDPTSAEDAELGYGQLFGAPSPLDLYPLRSGIAFDYDEDFFISSSARPFESLGIMSTSSQFFPGMHVKASLLERELSDDVTEEFPPPPSPLPAPTLIQTRTPSLDFTTPDSGVEDITPGSTSTDDDYKAKKLPEDITHCWRPIDSGSSSESVSPSSPGGEALGGLRHTRDKLKLDLPPSPHIPSPRHNRVFNFVLDKPKRHRITDEKAVEGTTPLVMSDETPVAAALPLQEDADVPDLTLPEPTFSTFGKSTQKPEPEQKIILTDELQENEQSEVKVESPKVAEVVRGEGTVLDSGDEDSGIESSAKAPLERGDATTPNVS